MSRRPLSEGTIAVLLPDLRGGGTERMRLRLAADWASRGLPVELVLLRREGELLQLVPATVPVVALGCRSNLAVFVRLVEYLRRARPAVLLVGMWPLTVIAAAAARGSGVATRVVVSEHAILEQQYQDRPALKRTLMRLTVGAGHRLADARIVISQGVARDQASLSRMPEEAFQVIYNPAASEPPASSDEDEDVPCRGRLILTVGALKPVKDHATLVRAFAASRAAKTDTLCILGEGPLRRDLERLVAELGLEHAVLLPGFRLDPNPFYRRASLFVLSSLAEGFGNVLVEALGHGLPVVSTDCPSGPREILADGEFGALVPVGDVSSLARALDATLERPASRDEQRKRARAFSVERISTRYLEVLFPRGTGAPSRAPADPS